MITRVILALALVLGGSTLLPAHAEPTPTIAVIDVGFNTDTFKNSIVTEVCVVQYVFCSNNTQSMEGPGASHVGATGYPKLFDHGTTMVSVILQVNPSAKIIPIRVLGQTPTSTPGVWAEGVYDLAGAKLALDWVIANKRNDSYDHPLDNFARIKKGWEVIFGIDLTEEQVGLAMSWVKIAREVHQHKRDNLTDGAGYLGTIEMVIDERERRANQVT